MTGSQPLVSIVMATFNAARTLDEALDSIASQSYPNWELVACDDGSTDETYSLLTKFAAGHPGRVHVLRNSENMKLPFSLNRCLDVAKGEFVARMDGDDRCAVDRLACLVTHLQSHPEHDVVGSAMRRFDRAGLKDVIVAQERPDRYSLRSGVPFFHATVCVRREVFEELGGYVVSRRTERGQDYDLWFRFFEKGYQGYNLKEPLYLVREDTDAIRRRTLRVRYYSFLTAMIGFQRLGYPPLWYLQPLAGLLKGFVPATLVSSYRSWQYRRFHQRQVSGTDRRAS